MQAKQGGRLNRVPKTVGKKLLRTAEDLFGRLEHEDDVPLQKLPMGREVHRGSKQAGRMNIVPAAVHDAGNRGSVRAWELFGLADGIDVGPQSDYRAVPAAEDSDDAGIKPGGRHLNAERWKLGFQLLRGVAFLKAELRVLMEVGGKATDGFAIVEIDLFITLHIAVLLCLVFSRGGVHFAHKV